MGAGRRRGPPKPVLSSPLRFPPMPRPSPALLTLLFAAPLGCKGASEPPNDGADEDSAPCDGWVRMVFPDADGDGFGVEEGAIEGCYPPAQGLRHLVRGL